jgi:hypothetical protein
MGASGGGLTGNAPGLKETILWTPRFWTPEWRSLRLFKRLRYLRLGSFETPSTSWDYFLLVVFQWGKGGGEGGNTKYGA